MSKEPDRLPKVLLPPQICAVGPLQPNFGPLHLGRIERMERGIGARRSLCQLPLQPYWYPQEIRGRRVCKDCLAAVEANGLSAVTEPDTNGHPE